MGFRRLATFAAACAVLALAGCGDDGEESTAEGGGAAGGLQEVRVLINDPIYNSNYADIVALEAGLFEKNGLDVELVPTQQPITPLFSGDVDITSAGLAPGLTARSQNQDIQVVANIIPRFAGILLAPSGSSLADQAGEWPGSVEALRGKRVGVTVAGATIDNQARYMLDLAGLTPDKDAKVLALGGGTPLVAAVEQGRVDAALVPDPLYEQLINRGKAEPILDFVGGEGPPELEVPYALSWTTGEYAEQHPDIIRGYVRAINETFEYMQDPANTDKVVEMLAERQEALDPSLVKQSLETFIATGLRSSFTEEDLGRGIALMKANGLLKGDIPYDSIVAPAAKEEWSE